ncbi:beta-ketoacyl synthase N-terminal-like domain-containing protein [Bacillus sp. SM2101]|uniref:beta-ketoacyl synthase N-terminal-like domain-containing protein n=1 Tax=Bacillus sp. SM2101 TaxID=2805366 RepID=UPI001BDE532F|nr:beta-ketoacyl synthase N-terminal-like domain-containing protein [Bacillus sp. SM2101]
MDNVYVTGTNLISSLGNEKESWIKIFETNSQPIEREYKLSNGSMQKYPVYSIREEVINSLFNKYNDLRIDDEFLKEDKDFILLLLSTLQCLEDANIDARSFKDKRIGLIIGHENLGVNTLIDSLLQEKTRLDSTNPVNSFNHYKNKFFRLQNYTYLYYLAKTLGINGPTYTVNNACASGLYALDLGSNLIKMDQADIVIVVAGDYAHVTEHLWLSEKGFSSTNGNITPFSNKATGSILGDGVGTVILESEKSLNKRNINPKAKYFTTSFLQDTWRINLPDVTAQSYRKVIQNSLKRYGESVDLIIPHGTGIPFWDKYESRGIKDAFDSLGSKVPDITAFKGYIGHTLGANSLIELIFGINSILSNTIPPINHGESSINNEYNLPFVTSTKNKKVRSLMKTVAAYGGFNASTIIEKV